MDQQTSFLLSNLEFYWLKHLQPNKVEFDNLIDQLFPGVGNYNTGMRRALKNMTFFVDKENLLNPNFK